jgi:fructose-bisphosphate aldolase class II
MTDRTAELDTDLIAALRDSVPVPLVLHGSSGVPDAGLVAAVRAGMTKVNIATHLNQVFTRAMTERLEASPTVDTRKYLGAARDAVTDEAARLMHLLAHP